VNTYVWLIKREFWENRAIWGVPAAIAIVLILASLFGTVSLFGSIHSVTLASPAQAHLVGGIVLFTFGVSFFVVMSIYSTWYLLDCLYADRKDRSVLFWKSLPISDTATVIAKLATALVVIPLVYFVAADVATLLMAFIVSVRASASFGSALWQPDLWLQLQALWLYLIVTTAIWYLPVAAWLLVISAWAKRAVMLWSILPPVAAYLAERWFLGTHAVATQLSQRMFGYLPTAFHDNSNGSTWVTTVVDTDRFTAPGSVWALLDPRSFFSNAQTWIGVVVGIALVVCAIQLRLRRSEI
jgi:ABC-2 type transport system permease protein